GDFVSIKGSLSVVSSGQRTLLGGAALTLFVGQGPAYLPDGTTLNPSAQGLLITSATVGLVKITSGGVDTYALTASGTIQVVGISGVNLAATMLTVRFNNTGSAIDEMVSIPGNPSVHVLFSDEDRVASVQADGATLTVLGQGLTGSFLISQ